MSREPRIPTDGPGGFTPPGALWDAIACRNERPVVEAWAGWRRPGALEHQVHHGMDPRDGCGTPQECIVMKLKHGIRAVHPDS